MFVMKNRKGQIVVLCEKCLNIYKKQVKEMGIPEAKTKWIEDGACFNCNPEPFRSSMTR